MKMSQENYLKFKDFFDYTVENASDADMIIIFTSIAVAAQKMAELQAQDKAVVVKSKHKA